MVKLIASDLDGTILRKGAQSVEPSTIKAIEQLVNKGMYFAPASGRQIVSLKRLFEPVSDKLVYIAENGALCEYKALIVCNNTHKSLTSRNKPVKYALITLINCCSSALLLLIALSNHLSCNQVK